MKEFGLRAASPGGVSEKLSPAFPLARSLSFPVMEGSPPASPSHHPRWSVPWSRTRDLAALLTCFASALGGVSTAARRKTQDPEALGVVFGCLPRGNVRHVAPKSEKGRQQQAPRLVLLEDLRGHLGSDKFQKQVKQTFEQLPVVRTYSEEKVWAEVFGVWSEALDVWMWVLTHMARASGGTAPDPLLGLFPKTSSKGLAGNTDISKKSAGAFEDAFFPHQSVLFNAVPFFLFLEHRAPAAPARGSWGVPGGAHPFACLSREAKAD